MTYRFWERYLEVFEDVAVVARVRNVEHVLPEFTRIDGPHVTVQDVPEYVGPQGYLKVRKEFRHAARTAVSPTDAALLRVGCSPLAAAVESTIWARRQPFGVEVITDPYMVFAPGAIRHPLRPVFRQLFTRQLKRQCQRAAASTYVTRANLQQRYPASPAAFSTSYSDVDLAPEAFVDQGRSGEILGTIPTIVSIGSMAQLYKGFDVLIDAVACCAQRGLPLNLVLVGDGKHRGELEQQVQRLGIQRQVTFTGQLAGGHAVREQLDNADLFVLASRTEGLPRVVIEAQARGLPCIGTRVGGIPELLEDSCLVEPNDPGQLTTRIMEFMCSSKRRRSESAGNLENARAYSQSSLKARRLTFLQELRDRTEDSLAKSSILKPNRLQPHSPRMATPLPAGNNEWTKS
jgi:glycosyltransferase involved in cell wall biosynthesis